MGIDEETKPTNVFISIEDNKEYINRLRKVSEEEGINDEKKYLLIINDEHSFEMNEYYFDNDGTINVSGVLKSQLGETYISFNIPLSDTVLIDILQHSIKKLNKFKTVLETLN